MDILSSIKEAEAQAEAKIKAAAAEARDKSSAAEEESVALYKQIIDSTRSEVSAVIKEAEQKADTEDKEISMLGIAEVEAAKALAASRSDEAKRYILERIVALNGIR